MGIDGVATGHSPTRPTGRLLESLPGKRGVFIARVIRVDVSNGTHIVTCATKVHGREFPAQVLMPFVSPDGLGFLAGIRKNTRCVVVSTNLEAEHFVVGFLSPDPAGLYAGPSIHQGDLHLASSGGAVVSSLASGDINLHSHDLCGLSLFQDDQRMTAIDRTFEHKHAGGKTTWGEATEDDDKHSDGDTWRMTEVRRERGKKIAFRTTEGNIVDGSTELVSTREVFDEDTGELLVTEEFEQDGTMTIRHPNGARFRMEAGGDVYVEPKSGSGVYINDPDGEAMGAARIGDKTKGHVHTAVVTLTMAGPWVSNVTVEIVKEKDEIDEGSSVVKVG